MKILARGFMKILGLSLSVLSSTSTFCMLSYSQARQHEDRVFATYCYLQWAQTAVEYKMEVLKKTAASKKEESTLVKLAILKERKATYISQFAYTMAGINRGLLGDTDFTSKMTKLRKSVAETAQKARRRQYSNSKEYFEEKADCYKAVYKATYERLPDGLKTRYMGSPDPSTFILPLPESMDPEKW